MSCKNIKIVVNLYNLYFILTIFKLTLMCVCVCMRACVNIWAFYVGAVRRNRILTSVTRSEVENVKIWLRYACDRDGGRQGRNRQMDGWHAQVRSNTVLSESDVEN
jgi:hypothetical protein